jgi:hypothetical protein
VTWKHVAIVLMGCLTACFGAWVMIRAPSAAGGPMVIALGGGVITGALGHAGQGGAARVQSGAVGQWSSSSALTHESPPQSALPPARL